jgi:CBS domain-containing membrane protein
MAILLAILAMFALHCLHPPSGAVALTAVLGGPEVHAAGFGFAFAPVALNSLLLLAVAVLYNKASGRRYPHTQEIAKPRAHRTADESPEKRLGFTGADLQAALGDVDQVLDISPDDLESLFRRVEARAFQRRFGETRCSDFMSRDVVAVEFGTELAEAWDLMQLHQVHALPVLSRARHVIGIVTRTDFLRHAEAEEHSRLGASLKAFLRRTAHTHSEKHEVVGQIMSAAVVTASADTPLAELVGRMSDAGFHHLPVIDADSRLAGMVTQSDLIAALYAVGLADARGPGA